MNAALHASEFVERLQQHRRILYKVSSTYCRDREDRRDLVQEMIVELWTAFPRYDGRTQFSTWAYRIAMNVAISHVRHRSRQQRDVRQTVSLDELGLDFSDADAFESGQADNLRTLQTLIHDLDELNRGLILLFLDGYSADETAEIMGISASNVSTRINRLKQKLTAAFAAQ